MRRMAVARAFAAAAWATGVLVTAMVMVGIGGILPTQPRVAIVVAAAVLAFGLTLVEPAILPLLLTPALLVVDRVGLGSVDLSWSDLALFLAFWPAVFLGRRPYSPPMRAILWLSLLYQATTMFTIVANPYSANVVEWFHAWLLVAGALIVGWTLGRAGYARAASTALMLTAMALAAVTIVQGVQAYAHGDFAPVYPTFPYHMHKNFVGTTLSFTAVFAYARPAFTGWSRRTALTFFWISVLGIGASQSRQALIGLAVALVVIVLRRHHAIQRSRLILIGLAPLVALVGFTVKDQIVSGNEFNSYFQRLSWIQDSMNVWSHGRLFGVGLRWWYTDRFDVRFQPPNAELEVLTSAGVIGLIGFLSLMIGAIIVLWRIDPVFGTAGATVLIDRLVQSQFDLFWVASQTSVPFLLAGICLGAAAAAHQDDDFVDQARRRDEDEAPSPLASSGAHTRSLPTS